MVLAHNFNPRTSEAKGRQTSVSLSPVLVYRVSSRISQDYTEKPCLETPCDGLYMIGPGSEPIRRCGLVGVGVSLWVWA